MNRTTISLALIVSFACFNARTFGQPPPPPPSAIGHSISTESLRFLNYPNDIEGEVEIPVAGRIKIADNTSPLPRDRVYYIYNHFHNAVTTTVVDLITGNPTTRSTSIERHTVGTEWTYLDERFSLELRLPILTRMSGDDIHPSVARGNQTMGNLSIIHKMLVFDTGANAFSTGMAITTPTGDDVRYAFGGESIQLKNEAVHVTPFVAFLKTPSRRTFFQSFLEIDIPVTGNTAVFERPGPAADQHLGIVNPQTAFCGDISFGYWLYQPGEMNAFSSTSLGLAAIMEFSYLTALQDADCVAGSTVTTNTDYMFGHSRNRFDVVVTTIGLHAEIAGNTTIRVGGVVPLTQGDNRFFDSEILFQLNRRF